MNIPSTIELLEAIKKDVEHACKRVESYNVARDYIHAISYIDEAIYALEWAKKHLKELEK